MVDENSVINFRGSIAKPWGIIANTFGF